MLQAVIDTDVLVVGAGAAGLTTAITARLHGLDVVVAEKEAVFGGTTAWSGGVLWVPCNSHQKAAGIDDSVDLAREYVRREAGEFYDPDRVEAYLVSGREMIDFLERETNVKFELSDEPDYHQDVPGALARGRALRPLDFDGRGLGRHYSELRAPARERVLFMGMQIGAAHLGHFMKATKSLNSFFFVTRRILSHLRDVLIHGRNITSAMGRALAGRLAKSAFDLGIPILLSAPVRHLVVEDGKVVGALLQENGQEKRVNARRGVVLAAGGFSHDYVRRKLVFPHHPSEHEHLSNTPPSNTGDGVRLGESAGGAFEGRYLNSATWYPTSRVKYPDGSEGNNAHLLERGKPGVIAVTQNGRRFADEAANYHDFVQAMFRACQSHGEVAAYYICDHRALRRYGLGAARPWPLPYRRYLRTGYLKRGRTIEELAREARISEGGLIRTLSNYNYNARQGRDPEFGKGENGYDISQGDPTHKPNPCIAPLEIPPFYAVKILPGDLGTLAGLWTDRHGRVLNGEGQIIPNLYAVGNDQASVFGGAYPGGGATLGPAMIFGYLAARHIAETTYRTDR